MLPTTPYPLIPKIRKGESSRGNSIIGQETGQSTQLQASEEFFKKIKKYCYKIII